MSKLKLGKRDMDYSAIHWFHGQNGRVLATYNDPKDGTNSPLSDLGFEIKPADAAKGKPETVAGRTVGGLTYSLYRGWEEREVCKVGTLEHLASLQSDKTVDELVALAVQEREEQIAYWAADDFTKALAVCAQLVWFPGGKPAAIEAFGNECFRRSLGVMGAIYRRTLPDIYTGHPLDPTRSFAINVLVKEWASDKERILDHLRENTGKDEGRAKLSTLDFLNTARQLHGSDPLSFSESQLMREGNVKRGTAQKLSEIIRADNQWRKVGLVRRMFLPAPLGGVVKYTEDCYIPVESVQASELRNIRNGVNWKNSSVKLRNVGVATYHRYLEDVITGKGDGTPEPLTAKEMDNLADSPCRIVAAVAKAIRKGDRKLLAFLAEESDKINDLLVDLFPEVSADEDDATADVTATEETADATAE